MADKLNSITRTSFRGTNFNAFLFFLFFAIFIWIIVQFSKEYNEIVEIPVEYVNIPPDILIVGENPDAVKLRMEETGFEIAYKSLLPPTLEIDLSQARKEDGRFEYVIDENREEVQAQLDINFERSSFLEEVISINYQQKKEKTIPVVSQVDLDFAVGYSAAGEFSLKTDSITVTGPDNILDTLNQLRTFPLTRRNIKEDLSGSIAIDTTHLSNVIVYQDAVEYFLDVEKFTEGNLRVPVELVNVPEGMNVVIFPRETLLFFKVSLQEYNEISATDFRVVCDFSKREEGQDFLVPEVREQPEEVENVRLNEKRISFIIKK